MWTNYHTVRFGASAGAAAWSTFVSAIFSSAILIKLLFAALSF